MDAGAFVEPIGEPGVDPHGLGQVRQSLGWRVQGVAGPAPVEQGGDDLAGVPKGLGEVVGRAGVVAQLVTDAAPLEQRSGLARVDPQGLGVVSYGQIEPVQPAVGDGPVTVGGDGFRVDSDYLGQVGQRVLILSQQVKCGTSVQQAPDV